MHFLEARFRPLVGLLLLLLAAAQITSIRLETQTWDEAIHLAAGYSYWLTGDFRLNPEHPPLGKYLNALPLLLLGPKLPVEHPTWQKSDQVEFGYQFLYQNTMPADEILFAARLVTIAATLALGLLIAVTARRWFGAAAGLAALALCALDPNVIAHGRYVTSDLYIALFSFAACVAWAWYLTSGRAPALIMTGILLGLAFATKFSAVFLLLVFPLLYGVRWAQQPQAFPVRRALAAGAVLFATSYLVIVACYAPEARQFFPMTRAMRRAAPQTVMLRDIVDKETTVGRAMEWLGYRLGLPANNFFRGINALASHQKAGHSSYLLGEQSEEGWWYYFPVVFAAKSPLALLAGLLLAVGVLAGRGVPRKGWRSEEAFVWTVLILPAAIYFGLSMKSRINIGVRHLLPVYPFLFVLIAAALSRVQRGRLMAAILAVLAIESAWIYPHYLTFFNLAAGGPENGHNILVDSNIDWGQDVKKLRRYLDMNGIQQVCSAYFGNAPFWYYKIHEQRLPGTAETKQRAALNCYAVVSVTLLHDVYIPQGTYRWVREREPIERVGNSIYIYDFRKRD